jgi:ABC-type sugar transport system ATPase subunit
MCRKGLERLKRSTILTWKSDQLIGRLVGGSGSGKSTLLRIIAGLKSPRREESGWQGKTRCPLDPGARNRLSCFKTMHYLHMTVSENIGFGLTLRNIPALESRLVSNNFASDTAGRVCQSYPAQLSGDSDNGCAGWSRDGTKGSPVR